MANVYYVLFVYCKCIIIALFALKRGPGDLGKINQLQKLGRALVPHISVNFLHHTCHKRLIVRPWWKDEIWDVSGVSNDDPVLPLLSPRRFISCVYDKMLTTERTKYSVTHPVNTPRNHILMASPFIASNVIVFTRMYQCLVYRRTHVSALMLQLIEHKTINVETIMFAKVMKETVPYTCK